MPISQELLKQIKENTLKNSCVELGGTFGESGEITDEDIYELVGALKKNPFIDSIDLSQNDRISDESAKFISSVSSLKEINFSDTSITSKGVQALLKSKAQELSISDNQLENSCLEGIQQNNTLRFLEMRGNCITLEGVKLIACNKTLEFIDLSRNFTIDDECAQHLASMKSLKVLNLKNNRITIEGAKILKASSIRDLFLQNNNFDYKEFLEIYNKKPISQMTTFPDFQAIKKIGAKKNSETEEVRKGIAASAKRFKSL